MIVAFKRDDPNAATSSIPLEKLTQKDFNRKEMQIDAPIPFDRLQISGAQTDAGDETAHEEETIIDSKALYKNFIDLVESNKLNINNSGQAPNKKDARDEI